MEEHLETYFDRKVVWHEKSSKRSNFKAEIVRGKKSCCECGRRPAPKYYTGRTICVLWRGDERFVGISHCSKKDNFLKKKGNELAEGRAMKVAITGVCKAKCHRKVAEDKKIYGFRFVLGDSFAPPMKLPIWMYEQLKDGEVVMPPPAKKVVRKKKTTKKKAS